MFMIYLYCIGSSAGYCKFGYSRDPAGRLRELQTGSPDALSLVHSIAIPESEHLREHFHARSLEKQLHREFAHLRVRGEWFNCTAVQGARFLQWFEIHYLQ